MAKNSYIDLTYLALLAFLVSGIVVVSEFPVTGNVVQGAAKELQNTGSARISVADKATSGLLYNARVYIYDAKGSPLKNSGTGQGEAIFANLKAGVYSASATASGYKAGKGTFRIVAGSETILLITMVKTAKEPTPTPAATGSVKINVIDKATRGTLSAIVSIYNARGSFVESRQTANGAADFSLGAGSYSFVVRAAGYRDKRDTFRIAGGARIETTVEMEKVSTTAPSPTSQNTSTGSVKIYVNDGETHETLKNARVSIFDSLQRFVTIGSTNSGFAAFSLRAGSYTASVTVPGYAFNSTRFTVDSSAETSVAILMRKTGTPTETAAPSPTTQSSSTGTVRITVTDRTTSQLLNNSRVVIYDRLERFVTAGGIERGVAVFYLRPGNYSATATSTGYKSNRASFTVEANASNTIAIELERASPGRQREGSTRFIVTSRNRPLSNGRIDIYSQGYHSAGSKGINKTNPGVVVFSNLPAGFYYFYLYLPTSGGYPIEKGTFTVGAGNETIVTVALGRTATSSPSSPNGTASPSPTAQSPNEGNVSVTVLDKATRGTLSAIVSMYNARSRLVESQQTANGVADFSLNAGDYSFVVRAAGYRDKRDTFRIAGGARIETTVEMEKVSPSPTAQTSSVGSARFRVIDRSTNQSVSGAKVYVYDSRGQFVGRNETAQAGGGIVVFSLRAGVYSAWTAASGYKAARTSSFRVSGNGESTVTVSLRR